MCYHFSLIRGETCVIFYAGPIGLLCLQAAVAADATHAIVVKISDKRLKKAREMDASLVINGKEESVPQQIKN
ncbi:unnamed protein product [Adineta ricciae]|uniref:Alcohol dehydrogenase-like C-terminal domain-containing protein n=1 Tax=Adineta ricciae TaxID=249248 RepID=A0A814M018_ADIRI|nr:unnamed protein product [Adineta ricciae]CAF1315161.1 unnamed protein product [Adineta ricciae]